jgi:enoyl-CoA hydratase/carnithine racemase
MSSSLVVTDEDRVRVLRLNRPDRLNALDPELRRLLVEALKDAGTDDGVRTVLITGTGERGFCAGQDLNESMALDEDSSAQWMASWKDYFQTFLRFPKPLVAAVNGVAAGAGLDLVMFGDIRLAVPTARFIMAEIDIGLPALFGSYCLAQDVLWSRAVDIVLGGRAIEAEEARRMGLIHEIAEGAVLASRSREVAQELAAKAPHAMRLNIQRLRHMRLGEMERDGVFEALVAYQREAIASGEPQKVMAEFFAKRAARRKG